MSAERNHRVIGAALDRCGTTYAEEAGIELADAPEALYRLLVLSTLHAAEVPPTVAATVTRSVVDAGLDTAHAMAEAGASERRGALAGIPDERRHPRVAGALRDGARFVVDAWGGDLRALRPPDPFAVAGLRAQLQRLPGVGPTGSAIFCREVQGVWPQVAPFIDHVVADGAHALRLPRTARGLARYVPTEQFPRLTAALARVADDPDLAAELRAA
jgi:hypothetical protein